MTVSSPVKSGMVSRQLVPTASERFVAQTINTGGVSSTTVRMTAQAALKPFVSVAVRTTPLVPNGSEVPGTGFWVMVKGLQSAATIWLVRSGAIAAQLVPALKFIFVGPEEMTGALLSITESVKVQVLELEAASLAVNVTR